MKKLLSLTLSLCALFLFSGTVSAQEVKPETLFKSEESGFLCRYVNTESDSPPPYFEIRNKFGVYSLTAFSNGDEWKAAWDLPENTPISFVLEVIYEYDEMNEEFRTVPYVTSIKKTGEPTGGACAKSG
ncbi:MAG: hypothetical protein LBR53_06645 [Deltaproteobacteria bacterium]|nr:hypothetical protein [Deltaproteobacteria bacterium]